MLTILMKHMSDNKITEQDLKDICKLSRAWPNAFKAAYLSQDDDDDSEATLDEEGD